MSPTAAFALGSFGSSRRRRLPVAIAVGASMNWLLHQGWYLIGLVPLVAAMLVGAAAAAGVIYSHCRNRLLAAALGGAAGLTMYLAYYYFGMLSEVLPGNAHRLDLLPQYIRARLETDVKQDLMRPRRGNAAAQRPRLSSNVAMFVLDIACSVVVAGFVPYLRSKRPYVKDLGQWMAKEEKRLPPGTLNDFAAACESGDLQSYAEQTQASLLGRARAELAGIMPIAPWSMFVIRAVRPWNIRSILLTSTMSPPC